jgi:hypothetical protein
LAFRLDGATTTANVGFYLQGIPSRRALSGETLA